SLAVVAADSVGGLASALRGRRILLKWLSLSTLFAAVTGVSLMRSAALAGCLQRGVHSTVSGASVNRESL
ncbi:hypothetical protein LY622_14555, partial [Halomonas sp. M5N1S17]|uniref:hypothetical protein n=1 Tax=Halomonas alkalisoli TaxID=2907158 RepID=UPI001F202C3E